MKIFASAHEFDYSWDEVSTANWRKYCPWNKESSHVIAVDTLSRTFDQQTGVLRTERLITCRQSAPKWLSPFLGGSDVSHVFEISYVTPPKAPLSSLPSADTASPSSLSHAQQPTSTTVETPTVKTAYTASHQNAEHLSGPTPSTLHDTPAPPSVTSLPSPPSHPEPRTPSVTMISQNLTWSDLLSVVETVTYTPSPSSPAHKTRFEQNARVTALAGGWAKIRERIENFTVERFGQNAEKGRAGFAEVLEMSRRVFGEEKLRADLQRERQNAGASDAPAGR